MMKMMLRGWEKMNTFFENVKKSEEKTPAESNKFGFGFGKAKHSSPYSQATS